MIFGKEKNKGLMLDGLKLKVVTIGENGITEDDILTHDMTDKDGTMHYLLSKMSLPEYPVAMGVIRAVDAAVYDQELEKQLDEAKAASKIHNMTDLVNSGETFEL